jgi:hypothetical protein
VETEIPEEALEIPVTLDGNFAEKNLVEEPGSDRQGKDQEKRLKLKQSVHPFEGYEGSGSLGTHVLCIGSVTEYLNISER